jgi:hypothetical protein
MQATMSMLRPRTLSTQNLNRRLARGVPLLGTIMTSLSGLYFLLLPSGSYQGGAVPWMR